MEKYTTQQLQRALIGLCSRTDKDGAAAFRMVFDEVAGRMGDAFDAWALRRGVTA